MPTLVASAAARPVGRRGALEALHQAVHHLVEHISESPPAQRRWRSAVRGVFPDIWQELSRDRRQVAERNLARMLHHLTRDCLTVEATADVTSNDVLLAARRPWLARSWDGGDRRGDSLVAARVARERSCAAPRRRFAREPRRR